MLYEYKVTITTDKGSVVERFVRHEDVSLAEQYAINRFNEKSYEIEEHGKAVSAEAVINESQYPYIPLMGEKEIMFLPPDIEVIKFNIELTLLNGETIEWVNWAEDGITAERNSIIAYNSTKSSESPDRAYAARVIGDDDES